jgi:TonB family protein
MTIAQALSAALLHFIWQGSLVACLLWLALLLLKNRTANARYLASCAAMALMAAMPAATAWTLYRQPAPLGISLTASTAIPVAGYMAQSAAAGWIDAWRQWALSVWSIGVLLFAVRLLFSCRHVAALRSRSHAADQPLTEMISRLASRMKVGRAIRGLVSDASESPSVVGWLRPAILLPAATLMGLEPEQLLAVLAHEMAHIRRHDYVVNLAQTLVETLLFYHPAVWWTSARIRHERELCCDDAAVAVCGNAIGYARALTSLERLRVAPRFALGSTGGSLLYRIQRLAGVKQDVGRSRLPGIAALALGVACFAVTVHWAKAQQMTPRPAVPREAGISISSTGEVPHRGRVPYPEAAFKNGIQGTVLVEAVLDKSGEVTDAHVLSGPPELRKAALQSVLEWQFANAWAGETQQVSIAFEDARAAAQEALNEGLALREREALSREGGELNSQVRRLREQADTLKRERQTLSAPGSDENMDLATHRFLEAQYVELQRKLADMSKSLTGLHPETMALERQLEDLRKKIEMSSVRYVGAPLAHIDIVGVTEGERDELAARIGVKIGDTLTQESIDTALAAIRAVDERLECGFRRDDNGNIELRIVGR